jgi:hypothetical protein
MSDQSDQPQPNVISQDDFYRQWLAAGNLPALQDAVPIPEPNEPISLYEGPLEATGGRHQYLGMGKVELVWLPTPAIRFVFRHIDETATPGKPLSARYAATGRSPRGLFDDFNTLSAVAANATAPVLITSHQTETLRPVTRRYEGYLTSRVVSGAGEVTHAVFLLPNFVEVLPGDGIFWERPDGGGGYTGRHVLVADGWKITLDNVWFGTSEARRNFAAGFKVSHVGQIERADGRRFQESDSTTILLALGTYLSFCLGSRTAPFGLTGFDGEQQLWQVWDWPHCDAHEGRATWFDRHHREHLTGPFTEFVRLWSSDYWRKVLSDLIHWYLAANGQAGAIDGSIMLTQAAFELLSSVVLVEQYGWLHSKAARSMPAEDKLRLLLRWASLPTEIPNELASLRKHGKRENWDGPSAMTFVRNKIVHPTRSNREERNSLPRDVVIDLWKLCLWTLELCILRLLGYEGSYGNRLKWRRVGEVDPMPANVQTYIQRPAL